MQPYFSGYRACIQARTRYTTLRNGGMRHIGGCPTRRKILMNRSSVPAHSDIEWLLLTTPDDTEEAPWMTTPEFQWRVCALLMSILERHKRAHGLRWYLVPELKVTMPREIIPRDLDLGPD